MFGRIAEGYTSHYAEILALYGETSQYSHTSLIEVRNKRRDMARFAVDAARPRWFTITDMLVSPGICLCSQPQVESHTPDA